jgi:flavin reductase (DIM6/NTAB) family NADH-FMN oxidoreductase RutF
MAIDPKELRRVLGHFATGVTIITTHDGEGRHYGLTANAVCSVSLNPPRLLICVDKKADSHPAFPRGGCFVVNVLAHDQEELSRRFAVSGGDKFTGVNHKPAAVGAAVLDGCLAHIECRLVETLEGGDHTIFIGEIENAQAGAGRPLLFFQGRYHRLPEP